jgi:hypothetical protein
MLRLYQVTDQLKYSLYRIRAFELDFYNQRVVMHPKGLRKYKF